MDDKSITMFLMECMAKALMELLKEKPISAISVAELTRKAGVARITFYRNYQSVEDVFDKYLDYLFRLYHEEVLKSSRHASFIKQENILLCFSFFRQNADLINILMQNRLDSMLRRKFIESELDLSLKSRTDVESKYLTIAYASTLFGILTSWLQDGMRDNPEALTAMICDLFQKRIQRY